MKCWKIPKKIIINNENIEPNKIDKWYFKSYQNETEEYCKLFFKEKLKDIFQNTDIINKETIKWKNSIRYTGSSFANILNKLENLKDNENNKITYKIEYDLINIFTKKMIN